MRKCQPITSFVLCLLCLTLLLPFAACGKGELPYDAEDPAEALTRYVKEFWDSEIYEDAIFDAIYNTKTSSDELKSFNRVNVLNAKYRILTKTSYKAETVSIDGTTAVVSLSVHGINFGKYAEVYLEAFDQLQANVIIIGDTMLGMSDEEVMFALRFMPIEAVDDERVNFRDFEQEFELKYKDGEWVIRKPAYKNGRVFLELFAEHITEVLNRSYKFRLGIGELQAREKTRTRLLSGYDSFGEFIKNQFWAIILLLICAGMVLYGVYSVIVYLVKKKKKETKENDENSYERLLLSLSDSARRLDVNGLAVELRDCVGREPGKLDPLTAAAGKLTRNDFRKNRRRIDKRLIKNELHLLGPEKREKYTPLEYFRKQTGWVTEDRSAEISGEKLSFTSTHGPVELWKYETGSKKAGPCVVYFHGGGFFGGVISTIENQCRLLAKLTGGTVFAVDYPLAPENKFPIGFDCCYEAMEWIQENAGELGVDPARISVAGDSAGGNLALCCALRARDENKDIIRYMGLIYPTVTRATEPGDKHYYFDESAYDNAEDDPYISEQINAIGKSGEQINEWYLEKDTDPMQPYVSPITASMNGLPAALVVTAEYDFLRPECEELSRRLKSAGVKQRHIRYGGITHGTFDRFGYAPQAEDMLKEMARDIRRLK